MKDILVSEVQIDTAKSIGADYILLIKTIFDQHLAEGQHREICRVRDK